MNHENKKAVTLGACLIGNMLKGKGAIAASQGRGVKIVGDRIILMSMLILALIVLLCIQ